MLVWLPYGFRRKESKAVLYIRVAINLTLFSIQFHCIIPRPHPLRLASDIRLLSNAYVKPYLTVGQGLTKLEGHVEGADGTLSVRPLRRVGVRAHTRHVLVTCERSLGGCQ